MQDLGTKRTNSIYTHISAMWRAPLMRLVLTFENQLHYHIIKCCFNILMHGFRSSRQRLNI